MDTELFFYLLVVYAFFSGCLMVIAQKTGVPNAWLAWIPLANLLVMCRAGRKSAGWVVLLLIPLVNIVFMVLVFSAIARVRGKPGWIGLLMLVPLVNLAVPLILALGPASAAVPAAAPSPAKAVSRAGECPECGAALAPGDVFCGDCGASIPSEARGAIASEAVAEPAGSGRGLAVVLGVAAVLLVAAVGWLLWGRAYAPPERTPPAMPQRMAGTLREFPVDTASEERARPSSFVTQRFGAGGGGEVLAPAETLPPGIDRQRLPRQVGAMTSATYRTPGGGPPVNVHVIESGRSPALAGEYTRGVARATGGAAKPVEVVSPQGVTYRGHVVSAPEQLVYILLNALTRALVVVYASEPQAFPVARRLASHVGNGEGLIDYPIARSSLGTLPAQPPSGYVLVELNTYTPEDWRIDLSGLREEMGDDVARQIEALVTSVRAFLPQTLVDARYANAAGEELRVYVGDFGLARSRSLWWFLRWTYGLSMQPVEVAGGPGIHGDVEGQGVVVFHKGPYVGTLVSETQGASKGLLAFAERLQL